jgi:glycerophosphoryl diester phosphodiesterase
MNLMGGGGGSTRFIDYTLIAHAGGTLFDRDGAMLTYTNSKEAIEQNYRRGHRVFEIDFSLTRDGYLAAVHDWEHGKRLTGENWTGTPRLPNGRRQKFMANTHHLI